MPTEIEGLSKEKVLCKYLYFCQSRYYDFEFNVWFLFVLNVYRGSKSKYIYKQQVSHLDDCFLSKILTYLSVPYISSEVLGLDVEAGRLFLPFLIYLRLSSSSSSVVEAVVVWSR